MPRRSGMRSESPAPWEISGSTLRLNLAGRRGRTPRHRPKRQPSVRCYAESEDEARWLADQIRQTLVQASLWELLQSEPQVRVWNEQLHVYVDPEHPDEDPDAPFDPDEFRWRVRLELTSVSELRRVRPQVPKLQRPVIEAGHRHIDPLRNRRERRRGGCKRCPGARRC